MAKKAAKAKAGDATATTRSATKAAVPTEPAWPKLSLKKSLACRTLLEDQILLIDNLFSAAECKAFVNLIEQQPLELTPPKKRGEAERYNYRISYQSPSFASALFALIAPHMPAFPYPASEAKPGQIARAAHSLNSNIRMYKYVPGQHFGQHYDDSTRDGISGARSEWTLLVYLSGAEDGVQGGETIFYNNDKKKTPIVAPLTRGTALLHRHGHECMLHEGSEVRAGTKYILRSDVMFSP
ncbi:hypothetical protein PENSPDRAFT_674790 [Peniophora sp. CONT]|nr:hypothetical protein PENSPDRAFT_674790 [Peniophora sp. CONT]